MACCIVIIGYPVFSRFGTWEISRGKHMPFSTWMPSVRTYPVMDRGLYLDVQAGPGMGASYSIPVRHPVLLWWPASAGQLPSEVPSPVLPCHTTTPFASIRLGLRLAKCIGILYIWLTFKNMCRARHTQYARRDRAICAAFWKVCGSGNFTFYLSFWVKSPAPQLSVRFQHHWRYDALMLWCLKITSGGKTCPHYQKDQPIYLDPFLHQALKLKSIETSQSMSEIINEVLKEALSEDADDLAAFDERANEPLISYEQMVKRLKKRWPFIKFFSKDSVWKDFKVKYRIKILTKIFSLYWISWQRPSATWV